MTPLKPLLYFSLFKHPLTEEEVYTYSDATSIEQVRDELNSLVNDKVVYRIQGFYLCENNADLIQRRLTGNKNARNIFGKARKVSRFISKFPYVEGVGISGSLSKGYYDDNGDIDFFIITSEKRLWIARTLLILYKKIFLLNSRKFFCVNYFVGANSLEISEKNRFTATELATLIPMCGNGCFNEFYHKNKWVLNFLPNKSLDDKLPQMEEIKKPLISRIIKWALKNKSGDYLDSLFLKITLKKWKAKFKDFDQDHFNVAMKSNKNVSKHHPLNYQRKVIDRLNDKYEEYQLKYNIPLAKENA